MTRAEKPARHRGHKAAADAAALKRLHEIERINLAGIVRRFAARAASRSETDDRPFFILCHAYEAPPLGLGEKSSPGALAGIGGESGDVIIRDDPGVGRPPALDVNARDRRRVVRDAVANADRGRRILRAAPRVMPTEPLVRAPAAETRLPRHPAHVACRLGKVVLPDVLTAGVDALRRHPAP